MLLPSAMSAPVEDGTRRVESGPEATEVIPLQRAMPLHLEHLCPPSCVPAEGVDCLGNCNKQIERPVERRMGYHRRLP